MALASRRVHFAGCTPHPHEPWMKQIARNLRDPLDGFLLGQRYLLMDRDTKFCDSFRSPSERIGGESASLASPLPQPVGASGALYEIDQGGMPLPADPLRR